MANRASERKGKIEVQRLNKDDPVNERVAYERLTGTDEMQAYLGWSRSKFFKWYPHMRADHIIFRELTGRPPRPRAFTFTTLLHRWLMIYAAKGITF